MPIQVAIVEDTSDIRNGLALLINGSEGYSCEHTFSNPEDALLFLPALHPDVVLMDINLNNRLSGIDCVHQLKAQMPDTQFLICTVYDQDESIFESLKAGATGYILKKTPPTKLLEAITEIYQGGSPMSSQIARKIISTFSEKPIPQPAYQLSERERDIIEALSKGLRYKDIALSLHISTDTVRTHIRNIYEKLQVHSRTEALNKLRF
ncbi:DNA-binding response regulator, NarL/FixJ family, contains REC and HTH domains [Pseudarcicella hirudinis]|uniref:DNA-binding response regulator, NarL/FixJ family, contains REC and HTH domains n=1 Tax=Pseudarcicella hirudinis TaxID=1079859 RepID=A0A1I5PK09_9BACT|nr:response regulator transcription factor [Pseudarcicella hirudinis]SFP34458.1 DNA-binding response regulator, NarL/FixJ family, contains REC and HTH domains [Pseudarcicella hirudinis]